MRAWLACGVFVSVFFICFSYLSPKTYADDEIALTANSYYSTKTCVQVKKDNGSYGSINDILGSDGIKKNWPNNTSITSNDYASIDKTNDCIVTKKEYDSTNYLGHYTVEIFEPVLTKLGGAKELTFKFTSEIVWNPNQGITWSAVDYRTIYNNGSDNRNSNKYNEVVGFCENAGNCPINTSMDGTMETEEKVKKIGNIQYGRIFQAGSKEITVSTHTNSGIQNPWFGVTSNYAVNNSFKDNDTVYILRCDGEGADCGVAGRERASADAVINVLYRSYIRNEFSGRARVQEGTGSYDSTTNKSSSGYILGKNGSANTITVNCSNTDGCKAKFYFDLKAEKGSGSVPWQIQKRSATKDATNSNGEAIYSWSNVSGSKYSGPSTPSSSGTNVVDFESALNPGQTVCYRIVYSQFTDEFATDNEKARTVTACAKSNSVTFSGYSKVISGSQSASTGWKNTGKTSNTAENTAWLQLSGCDDGCSVTWQHGIKSDQGLSSSTTNYKVTTRGKSEGVFPTTSPPEHSATLYTGQILCRGLEIDSKYSYSSSDGSVSVSTSSTRACVYAMGTAGSTIDIKAKKSSSTSWVDAPDGNPIWAKPTDVIDLKGEYTPKYQRAYNRTQPYTVKIEGTGTSTISVSNDPNDKKTIQQMFDSKVSPGWNNAFSIKLSGNQTAFDQAEKTNTIGKADKYSLQKTYTISSSDTGKSITASALTNNTDSTKTTPKQINFTYSPESPGESIGKNLVATVNRDSISDNAYIKVPYNFINTTSIITSGENIVYAGESKGFRFTINTNPRQNNTTDGKYATIVKNAKWKLEFFYNGGSISSTEKTGTLNSNSKAEGVSADKTISINIPDVIAGTEVCVRSAVYPKDSFNDTNLKTNAYDSGDANSWAYSERVCFIVAKRPSLQIWGGNVYSRGRIATGTSIKNNLAGITDYDISTKNNDNYVFGSWGELGIIASDRVTGLASGAATGLPLGNLERTNDTSFCHRSPLSFANIKCKEGAVGVIGASPSIASTDKDKQAIIDKFFTSGEPNISSGAIALNEASENYYHSSGDLTVETSTVYKGATKVIHSDGDITINGNIYYDSEGSMILNDIPKLVIYAENIIINCDVTNIDAILVANQNVKTCQSDDINSPDNSNPLTINGAVISNSFTPNRTYGAATGINSVVPAEIINFDPTLYLWGGSKADDNESILLDTTYIREVSPRYQYDIINA